MSGFRDNIQLLLVAQERQLQTNQHKVVESDPDVTDNPVNSYVLYTPPMGRSNELLPKHKGPYQVIGKRQSIYIIEDLVKGKQIKTRVHNLRPFVFNPTQVNPLDVAQQNEQEFVVEDPPWSSCFNGLVTTKAQIAGNHTRLSCMWTSFMITYESTGCEP